jgi:molybdopterin/thiamine biosynthesis adenylyltransferase
MSNTVSYGRQTEILDPQLAKECHVTICGLGTIGSHAAMELARMGVGSLHLIDGDVVEAHNLPSQAYNLSDLGRPKSEALQEHVEAVSDHITVRSEQVMLTGGEFFDAGPVILAVDNMDARKTILETSVVDQPDKTLLIDGRMGGKGLQLLAFNPCTDTEVAAWHDEFWFPQADAAPIPCGGRSVSFIGSFTGGMIASYVCRHLNGKAVPGFFMIDLDNYMPSQRKTLAPKKS